MTVCFGKQLWNLPTLYCIYCTSEASWTVYTCLQAMARFASEEELRTFLRGLDPDYVQYAVKLWQSGIRTPHHLANASRELLLSFVRGICNSTELHIDDIKARAVGKGEKLLLVLACAEVLRQPALCSSPFGPEPHTPLDCSCTCTANPMLPPLFITLAEFARRSQYTWEAALVLARAPL